MACVVREHLGKSYPNQNLSENSKYMDGYKNVHFEPKTIKTLLSKN